MRDVYVKRESNQVKINPFNFLVSEFHLYFYLKYYSYELDIEECFTSSHESCYKVKIEK